MNGEGRNEWRWAGVALVGLAVAGAAACGGTDSRQEGTAEREREEPVWHTELTRVTTDADSSPARSEVEAPRRTAPVSFEEAESVFRTGEYLEAADLFEAYAERRPDNPWGHYMVGISAWRAGDHARAEEALRRTIELEPEHRKGLLNLARVLLERNKAREALEHVEVLVELEPQTGEGWRVLGNARSSLGQVEGALEAYREALALNPLDSWTMNNLGLLLIRAGRYEDALGPLARATELRPDVARFQNNLGIALERSGHLQEASEAYRTALETDPGHERARVSLERVEGRLPGQLQASVDLERLARGFEEDVGRWHEELDGRLGSEEGTGSEDSTAGDTIDAVGKSLEDTIDAFSNPAGDQREEPMEEAEPKESQGEEVKEAAC